ncbi:MAG: Hint domain-containing protein [Polyangiaceae bacterium]
MTTIAALSVTACAASARPKSASRAAGDGATTAAPASTQAAVAPVAERPTPPSRAARAAPWENVPVVIVSGTGSKLEAAVPLAPLEDGAAALDIVLAEVSDDPGSLVDLACTDGFVGREIDRATFDAALSATGPLSLVVELELPAATRAPNGAARRFAARACLREASGAIEGMADAAALVVSPEETPFQDPVVTTPSGPVVESLVGNGYAVVGWDTALGKPVIASVLATKSGGAKNVSFRIADGRTIAAPMARTFFLPDRGEWRAASALEAGDRIYSLGGALLAVQGPAVPSEDLEVVRVESDSAGTFIDGLLTSDGTLAKKPPTKRRAKSKRASAEESATTSTAPSRAPFAPTTEDVRWIPSPQSYDCQLETTLEVAAVPEGALAIALVLTAQTEAPGAREPASCDGEVVREVPASFVQSTRAFGGRYAVTLGEDEVACDEGYALNVCLRGADGRLAPLRDGQSRYGLAGASCFAGATPIATPRGEVTLDRLRRGDTVLGLDGATGALGKVRVTHVKALERTNVGEIQLDTGVTLEVTADHPFFQRDGSLVRASELEPGAELVGVGGGPVRVVSVSAFDRSGRVYDLSVDGPHDYFAGGVLVHNY